MARIIRFADYAPSLFGEHWFDAPSTIGTSSALASAPTVVTSGGESWLAEGRLAMAQGAIAPGAVTRLTCDVDISAVGAFVRIVLPYSETSPTGGFAEDLDVAITGTTPQYVEVDAVRRSDGLVEIIVYLTDPMTGLDHALLAYSLTSVAASSRAVFTVEAGPRYVRAWWQAQGESEVERIRCRFQRSEPDVAAHFPDIDALTWGILTRGGRVYRIELATDERAIEDGRWAIEAVTEAPDEDLDTFSDTSSVALAQYQPSAHAKRRRGQVVVALYGEASNGTVADNICHRLDPSQTLVPAKVGVDTTIRVGTVLEGIAGPSESATFSVTEDPTGLDGGIGSARSSLDVGGELALNPGFIRGDSVMGFEQMDIASDTGGQEAFQQVASRQRRKWDIRAGGGPGRLRNIERVLAASGGVRPVWFMPPLTPQPVPVSFSGVSHEIQGAKKATVTLTAAEL